MMDDKKKLNKAYALYRKYNDLPRAGWVVKGSRAKANQSILLPRTEAVELASNYHDALYSKSVFAFENANLRHYLETLAQSEHDAIKCGKCHGVYRKGWLKGKCIFCEASDAAFSMVKSPEPCREDLK